MVPLSHNPSHPPPKTHLPPTRRYLASCSDRQIDEHFAEMLVVSIPAILPSVYLTSEAIGCTLFYSQGKVRIRRTRLLRLLRTPLLLAHFALAQTTPPPTPSASCSSGPTSPWRCT